MTAPAQPVTAIAAAENVAELVAANADAMEGDRQLAAPVVDALRDRGLFHIFAPSVAGGFESDLVSATRAVARLSMVDGATGWCSMIASQWSWFAAFLPAPGAAEVLDGSRSVIAGQLRASGGTATAVEGGHIVSGRWPFASGCRHSTWLAARCTEISEGEKLAAPLVVFFQAEDAEILDTWHTSGLRATGSDDFVVRDAFVPDHRSFRLFPMPVSAFPGRLYGSGLYSLPFVTQAGNALGIADAAIGTYSEMAARHSRGGTELTLAESQASQIEFAEATVLVRAAWAYLESIGTAYWDSLQSGTPTLGERVDLRLAITHAIRSTVRAVNLLHELASATAVYAASPLDRQWRDINAAGAHVQAAPRAFELAARVMLHPDRQSEGLAPYPLGVS